MQHRDATVQYWTHEGDAREVLLLPTVHTARHGLPTLHCQVTPFRRTGCAVDADVRLAIVGESRNDWRHRRPIK